MFSWRTDLQVLVVNSLSLITWRGVVRVVQHGLQVGREDCEEKWRQDLFILPLYKPRSICIQKYEETVREGRNDKTFKRKFDLQRHYGSAHWMAPRNNSIVLVAETSYIESLHWTDTLILYIRNKFEILITLFLITSTHPHKILRTTELATLIITNLALCQAKVVVAIVSQTLTNDLFKYSILYLNDWFCASCR